MKKENNLVTFLKGFIIGLGVIFPVSASVLAIVMGLYERILGIVNNFKESLKKDLKFIIYLFLGVVVSCIVSCIALKYTLDMFPIATLLFFIGLIIGGLPVIFKKTKKEFKVSNIVLSICGIAFLILISFISGNGNANLSFTVASLFRLFVVGFIGAGSMMVPGVSGSVMLIILGYYEPMLNVITELVHLVNIGPNIIFAIVFSIGMLIGVIFMSKLMGFFLKNYEVKSYFLIIGFVLASIINVIISLFGYSFNLIELIVGIALFIVGFIISFRYLKEE